MIGSGVSLQPTVTWSADATATSWDLKYSTNATLSGATTVSNITTNTNTFPSDLTAGRTYYWVVIAKNAYGSKWSQAYFFHSTDLRIANTVSAGTVGAGDEVTYTVTLTNRPCAVTRVEVVDSLPAGITHVSNDPSQGTYHVEIGDWNVGDMAANRGDGVPDRLQVRVTTLMNYDQTEYVTLESPVGTNLSDVHAIDNPSPGSCPRKVH